MALANFFDKTALAASHILNRFDLSHFAEMLSRECIGVSFDNQAAASQEGRLCIHLVTNLLARLYPRITLMPRGKRAEILCAECATEAQSINPNVELVSTAGSATFTLAIQRTRVRTVDKKLYLGSHGWLACLSQENPCLLGNSGIPFGAGAAACFGVANVFRNTFFEHLPDGNLDREFIFSTLDFDLHESVSHIDYGHIDLGNIFLAGAGAIGNGAAWALSHIESISGNLVVIDPELVELSNLQRYVVCDQKSIAEPKVEILAKAFQGSNLKYEPYFGTWGSYLAARSDWRLERVAAAVDNAEARQSIQASLPRWIANAWTQPENLGVSRHVLFSDQACLCCLYIPKAKQKDRDEIIAEAIGLPDARLEVRARLANGIPTDKGLLERIALALGIPLEPLLMFEGAPLQEFYSKAVCGGVILKLGRQSSDPTYVQAPMVFQSCLAGIFLAAEIVADVTGLRQHHPLPVKTSLDILRPIGDTFSFHQPKHPSCICLDNDYQAVYRLKYTAT